MSLRKKVLEAAEEQNSSKEANNAVMETDDPDVSATCKDLSAVKKVFQLALLCTKKQPSDRPTMHEVARVLGSLVQPPPPPKQQQPALLTLPAQNATSTSMQTLRIQAP